MVVVVVVVVVVAVLVVAEAPGPRVAAEGSSFLGQEHTGVLGGSADSCGDPPDQTLFIVLGLFPHRGRTRGALAGTLIPLRFGLCRPCARETTARRAH